MTTVYACTRHAYEGVNPCALCRCPNARNGRHEFYLEDTGDSTRPPVTYCKCDLCGAEGR